MPQHKIHRAFTKEVLGEEYDQVNKILDSGLLIEPNPQHRDFFHDLASLMALFGSNVDLLNAGILHLLLDQECSNDKELHKLFRVWAEMQS